MITLKVLSFTLKQWSPCVINTWGWRIYAVFFLINFKDTHNIAQNILKTESRQFCVVVAPQQLNLGWETRTWINHEVNEPSINPSLYFIYLLTVPRGSHAAQKSHVRVWLQLLDLPSHDTKLSLRKHAPCWLWAVSNQTRRWGNAVASSERQDYNSL